MANSSSSSHALQTTTVARLESNIDVLSKDLKVMDAAAISLARENQIPIIVFSIRDHGSFARVIAGEGKFTIITDKP